MLPKPKKLTESILEQLQDPMIKALGALAFIMLLSSLSKAYRDYKFASQEAAGDKDSQVYFISFAFQQIAEPFSIFAAIILITLITAVNDYGKEKQFLDLLSVAKDYDVSCIRGQDGTTAPVDAWELVVGDIITFQAGDRIPADSLLLESIDLVVDEAYHNDDAKTLIQKRVTTEENHKDNPDSFLLAESLVVEGSGKAIVLVVCDPYCTRYRRVISQNDDDQEVSPLQQRLGNIGSQIGKLGIYASGALLVVLALRTAINYMASSQLDIISDGLESLIEIFVTCITLIMVAVPEGLPLSVSISVAYSLKTMKK